MTTHADLNFGGAKMLNSHFKVRLTLAVGAAVLFAPYVAYSRRIPRRIPGTQY
jgi:hypothetical protein